MQLTERPVSTMCKALKGVQFYYTTQGMQIHLSSRIWDTQCPSDFNVLLQPACGQNCSTSWQLVDACAMSVLWHLADDPHLFSDVPCTC